MRLSPRRWYLLRNENAAPLAYNASSLSWNKMEEQMQFATVTYPSKDGATFDFDYYMKTHIPMVCGLLGTSIEVVKGISPTPDAAPAFVCVARIRITSAEEFLLAMVKHGTQIMQDIPNYTNITPVVQIDEVLTPS